MLAVVACSLVCAISILGLEAVAPKLGLTDKPSGRKHHEGDIPVVGGIAIFLTIALSGLLIAEGAAPPVLIALSLLILMLGTADDVRSLSARFRLAAQIAVSLALVVWGDIRIETIGSVMGSEPVVLQGVSATIFTVMFFIGVINAVNMIDGVDGLSGSVLLVSFAALALLSASTPLDGQTLFLLCISGSLVAFLAYNSRLVRSRARIFMGDAGSMMLGLILAWYMVDMSQGQIQAFSSVSMGWLLGLPLMETISLMVNRVIDKRSPFDAGRDHMHHKLMRAGFGVNSTVVVMTFVHVCLVCVGVVFSATEGADAILFWGFIGLTAVYFGVSRYLIEGRGTKAEPYLET